MQITNSRAEYPTVREGAALLDRIGGVRLYALNGSERRELKQARKDDHFLYEGQGAAPVTVGVLD